MDGIDAVLIETEPQLHCLAHHDIPLPSHLKQTLLTLCQDGVHEIELMGRIDRQLGELFAEAVLGLLQKTGLNAHDIQAIGSHGQTIRHRPEADHPFSLQIADPNTITERTGITVVADFRRRDIAAGGQGAPLVPAFHDHLFRHPTRHRIVLNLGGIANITVLDAEQPSQTYGFDTGPANMLLDAWIHAQRGLAFDKNGEWAAQGQVHNGLLAQLLKHPYLQRPAPKSTGREDFHLNWLKQELNRFESISANDVQATLLAFTVESVALHIKQTGLNEGDLLVCGGGAQNNYLLAELAKILPFWKIDTTAALGIDPQHVEAAAFAWFAAQTLNRQPSNLPSVTGAQGPRILGGIYYA